MTSIPANPDSKREENKFLKDLNTRLIETSSVTFSLSAVKFIRAICLSQKISAQELLKFKEVFTEEQKVIIGFLHYSFKSVAAECYTKFFVSCDGNSVVTGPMIQDTMKQINKEQALFLGSVSTEERIRIERYKKVYSAAVHEYERMVD
jgi:hypothetical protein